MCACVCVSAGGILFQFYLAKVKLQIMKHFELSSLYDSGALLTRLKGEPPVLSCFLFRARAPCAHSFC
jgi:hypothetical protein